MQAETRHLFNTGKITLSYAFLSFWIFDLKIHQVQPKADTWCGKFHSEQLV